MFSRVPEALFILFRAYVIFSIYYIAKKQSFESKCHPIIAIAWAIGIPAAIALVSWAGYGTHTEDADPLFGGGYTVQDFIPTGEERNAHGVFLFIVILVPSLYGVYHGLKARYYN